MIEYVIIGLAFVCGITIGFMIGFLLGFLWVLRNKHNAYCEKEVKNG